MQIQILPEDLTAAFRLHERPRGVMAWLGIVVGALFFLASGFWVYLAFQGRSHWYSWLGPVCGTYLVVWYWLLVPRKLRKLYAQQKAFHEPADVELVPNGISFSHAQGSGILPFTHMHRWLESTELFLIYQSDVIYTIIPKRFFSSTDALAEFRAALVAHVGPANNSRKHIPPG